MILEQRWAPRIRPWHLARLYRLAGLGVYDDELLLEVGWGLYARCLDVVMVAKAVGGEVPCPACGAPVIRPSKQAGPKLGRGGSLACEACGGEWTWWDVKEALRNQPKCLGCHGRLYVNFARNVLACTACREEWTWKKYRGSVASRTRLPCPRCEALLRRPPTESGKGIHARLGHAPCPACGEAASHLPGRLHCDHCGHEMSWRAYRRRQKRLAEALVCPQCEQAFTWAAWRDRYRGRNLLTGKPAPAMAFLEHWREAKTATMKLHAVDRLVNALHGRGAIGPLFIEGDEREVALLLDRLANV